jgi:hypothetical protein
LCDFFFIAFEKGASILYMLQRVLGEEIMRRGLMLYLERHQYGNANMDDLWHALSLGTLNSSHPVPVKVVYFLLIFLILLWPG